MQFYVFNFSASNGNNSHYFVSLSYSKGDGYYCM